MYCPHQDIHLPTGAMSKSSARGSAIRSAHPHPYWTSTPVTSHTQNHKTMEDVNLPKQTTYSLLTPPAATEGTTEGGVSRLSALRPSPLCQMSSAFDATWEPPKPWSPKPLTPLTMCRPGGFSGFGFLDAHTMSTPRANLADDLGYYGSPQADWTPPKLPACAHSTPEIASVDPLAAASLNTTLQTPPNGTPPKDASASSGYGSDCSALFGFSPTALCLDGFDASYDVITALGMTSPREDRNRMEKRDDEDYRPLPPAPDVIFTGMSNTIDLFPQRATPSPVQPSPETTEPITILPEPHTSTTPPRSSTTETPDVSPTSPETPPKTPETSPSTTEPQKSPPSPDILVKPKEPYFALIAKAILESAEKRLILGDIYDIIQSKYPYFQSAETSWRNVIRHNLSVNDCFIKVGRAASGRGCYWGIHPSCTALFTGGDFRRREARRLVQEHEEARKGAGKENQPPPVNHLMMGVNHLMQTTPLLQTTTPLVGGGYQYGCYSRGGDVGQSTGGVQSLYPGHYSNPGGCPNTKDTGLSYTGALTPQDLYQRAYHSVPQGTSSLPTPYLLPTHRQHYL